MNFIWKYVFFPINLAAFWDFLIFLFCKHYMNDWLTMCQKEKKNFFGLGRWEITVS